MNKYHVVIRKKVVPANATARIRHDAACGRYGLDIIDVSTEARVRPEQLCATCARLLARSIERHAQALV